MDILLVSRCIIQRTMKMWRQEIGKQNGRLWWWLGCAYTLQISWDLCPTHTTTVPFDNVWTLHVSVSYTFQAHWGGLISVQFRYECGIPMSLTPSGTFRSTFTTLTEPLKSSVCHKFSISKSWSLIVRKSSVVSTKMKRDLKLLFLSWSSCF